MFVNVLQERASHADAKQKLSRIRPGSGIAADTICQLAGAFGQTGAFAGGLGATCAHRSRSTGPPPRRVQSPEGETTSCARASRAQTAGVASGNNTTGVSYEHDGAQSRAIFFLWPPELSTISTISPMICCYGVSSMVPEEARYHCLIRARGATERNRWTTNYGPCCES